MAGAQIPADPVDEHDVSYEDAIFDLQLRNFFRAEYGQVEPPPRAFPRLLAAIRAHERGQAVQEAPRPIAAMLSVYRALRTTTAHRLVSGGIAAALMIAVISSNSASFLRGAAVSLVTGESTPTAGWVPSSEDAMELATTRDDRYVVRISPAGSEPEFYDPVELRIHARVEFASGNSTPVRWQRFGGQ